MADTGFRERIVVGSGEVDAGLVWQEVGARPGDRQHLDGDAAGVHVGQPSIAEVCEFVAFDGLRPNCIRPWKAAAGDRIARDAGDDAGDGVMLFQGDDAHMGVLSRGLEFGGRMGGQAIRGNT